MLLELVLMANSSVQGLSFDLYSSVARRNLDSHRLRNADPGTGARVFQGRPNSQLDKG